MRSALASVALVFCVSCSMFEQKPPDLSDTKRFIRMPQLSVDNVRWEDGIERDEAAAIADVYFHRFISGCGMTSNPSNRGEFWWEPLPASDMGGDAGQFWILKDGRGVFFEPSQTDISKRAADGLKNYGVVVE